MLRGMKRNDARLIWGLTKFEIWNGPGSAAPHCVLRCARDRQMSYGTSNNCPGATLADMTGRLAASAIAVASPLAMQA